VYPRAAAIWDLRKLKRIETWHDGDVIDCEMMHQVMRMIIRKLGECVSLMRLTADECIYEEAGRPLLL
jgi:hypothetical protein